MKCDIAPLEIRAENLRKEVSRCVKEWQGVIKMRQGKSRDHKMRQEVYGAHKMRRED